MQLAQGFSLSVQAESEIIRPRFYTKQGCDMFLDGYRSQNGAPAIEDRPSLLMLTLGFSGAGHRPPRGAGRGTMIQFAACVSMTSRTQPLNQ